MEDEIKRKPGRQLGVKFPNGYKKRVKAVTSPVPEETETKESN